MTKHRGSILLLLVLVTMVPGCAALGISDSGDFEKVTKVWVEPANPDPGDTVDVYVEWESNLTYLAMVGAGPKVRFRVDAGTIIMSHDPMLGNTRISDKEALVESKHVKWQLPFDASKATLRATMTTGGKSLTVYFD